MGQQHGLAAQCGFTLVELLIVVIIVAILAAIVVPQFSAATDDAKLASLDATLANMRTAIDLYHQQHGVYPSSAAASGATCPGSGTAGTGTANSVQAFVDQMAMYTDASGKACTTSDATFKYGPYLKKTTLPQNPFTTSTALVVSTTGALGMTSSSTTGGWKFDNKTGQFIADHSSYDDR
jgi:prepilin-type N-terminal cleavage/methylation domain-containing protein